MPGCPIRESRIAANSTSQRNETLTKRAHKWIWSEAGETLEPPQCAHFNSAAAPAMAGSMLSRFFFAVLVTLTLTFSVAALAAEPRLLTPQDLWAIKRVGSPALSPDGRHAVFPVQEW